MTCQRCEAEATVHWTGVESSGGASASASRGELHLCESCARSAGLLTTLAAPLPVDAAIEKLIKTHVGELTGALARLICPDCGLKYMEYRADGRLGCARDYELFARGLEPQLRRMHGASRHVGKISRRGRAADERLRLRALLRQAAAREDYEAAAAFRDQLRSQDAHA